MAKKRNVTVKKLQKQADIAYLEELAKEDPTAKTRGKIIQERMKEKNISYADITRKTGLSFEWFLDFMSGKTNIRPDKAQKIADILDLKFSDIMKDDDEEDEQEEKGQTEETTAKDIVAAVEKPKEEKKPEETKENTQDSTGFVLDRTKDTQESKELFFEDFEEDDFEFDDTKFDIDFLDWEHPYDDKGEELILEDDYSENSSSNQEPYEQNQEPEEQAGFYYGYNDYPDYDEKIFTPSDKEIKALLTLCTEEGKRRAYEAIWQVLQDPDCRKGGRK